MRREAPRLGGSFANWGLTFALFDCSLQYVRKKVRLSQRLEVWVGRCSSRKAGAGGRVPAVKRAVGVMY